MKRISLIANSSIQYYKFKTDIVQDFGRENKLFYHEPFDHKSLTFILDPLFRHTSEGEEYYFRKQELQEKNAIVNGRLKENESTSQFQQFPDVFEEGNLRNALKHYQKKWIPLPFFKDNSINQDVMYPTDWVRVFIDCSPDLKSAEIVLAVDTTLSGGQEDKTGPSLSLNPDENIFRVYSNDANLASFLYSGDSTTSWMGKYLADVYYGRNEEARFEAPIKKYAASYLLLVRWLQDVAGMPEIQLFTNAVHKKEVDLVVDIGNSATCALLFESKNSDAFEFESVKKLIVQDYTDPLKQYDNPFPMNLIFSESKFGDFSNVEYHNNKFIVPSFVRIGYEAEKLINSSITDLSLGYELKTYNSSPKRYLWDQLPASREWEYNPDDIKKVKKVYLNGISDQIGVDGTLLSGNEMPGARSLFSRNSLMKFVFLELIMHAYVQINSYEFREEHGDMTVPRTLKRITISCPTGMIQHEQIALRQAAEDACKLLNNYVKYYFDSDFNNFWFEMPEIIPSVRDISRPLSQIEDRKDWIYDEATSSQLVFVYSLFAKKLKGNKYVIDNYLFKNKSNLTVGSIDIGAGTTDLMINRYSVNAENGIDSLKPIPVFWDSFRNAGDNLLKEIIQKIIIEGTCRTPEDEGCTGVIENFARAKGVENISDKLNGFFGQNSNQIGFKAKVIRKAFVNQVAIPIALAYLNNANSGESYEATFEKILGRPYTNKEVINYFERHFGFSFLEIVWKISPAKVNLIVEAVFDPLIRQLSVVLNQFQCDYVVLSGKPASLKSFESMFRKYLATSPNNIVNLNNHWVGTWYPFADSNGYIEDPKTIVCVGAIVALMSGKLMKIQDLKLDTEHLRKNLISTADFIVKNNGAVKEEIITPKKNETVLKVSTLPFQFGYSKYLAPNYPFSDLYSIQINSAEVENLVRRKYPNRDDDFIKRQIEVEKATILQNMPLKVNISRDFDESKEILKIESVEDAEGTDKSPRYFSMNYQTLDNSKGYWLDTCEFILNVGSPQAATV